MKKVRKSIYITKLARRLKKYINYYLLYNRYQTKRHQLYDKQVSIPVIDKLFHTITLDFILTLPNIPEVFNTLLIITDKYIKRVVLIPGKDK